LSAAKPSRAASGPDRFDFFGKKSQMGGPRFAHRRPRDVAGWSMVAGSGSWSSHPRRSAGRHDSEAIIDFMPPADGADLVRIVAGCPARVMLQAALVLRC